MTRIRFSPPTAVLLLALLIITLVHVLPAGAQEEFISRLTPQNWGDWAVVMLTIGATQLIKILLPGPDYASRWTTAVTDRINRILPYLPIAVAAALTVLWHRGAVVLGENGPLPAAPLGQLIEHGAALGIYAAYIYRAGKVTIFGK